MHRNVSALVSKLHDSFTYVICRVSASVYLFARAIKNISSFLRTLPFLVPPPISVYGNLRSIKSFILSYRVRTANYCFLCLVSSVLSARRDFEHACMHAGRQADMSGDMNEHSSDAVQNLVAVGSMALMIHRGKDRVLTRVGCCGQVLGTHE